MALPGAAQEWQVVLLRCPSGLATVTGEVARGCCQGVTRAAEWHWQLSDTGAPRYSSGQVWRRQRDDHVLVVMVAWGAEGDDSLKKGVVAGCGCVSGCAKMHIVIRNLVVFYRSRFSLLCLTLSPLGDILYW